MLKIPLTNLRKAILIEIAEEIGIELPLPHRIITIKDAIENIDIFKNDNDKLEEIVGMVINDFREREEKDRAQVECEKLKLAQLDRQLEIERLKTDPTVRNVNIKYNCAENLENLVKSVKTLTIAVQLRSESYNYYFQSLEKSLKIKNLPEHL